MGWVLGLAGLARGMRVPWMSAAGMALCARVRAGRCGRRGVTLSMGMLRSAAHPALFSADVAALPVRDGAFDAVLAVHMLYHVPDRVTAVRELRRVLAAGGVCVAVTNGAKHTRALRDLVERAVGRAAPGWRMTPATQAFTAENAVSGLRAVFGSVTCVRQVLPSRRWWSGMSRWPRITLASWRPITRTGSPVHGQMSSRDGACASRCRP